MELRYSEKRYKILKWLCIAFIALGVSATPGIILEVMRDERPIWGLALGPAAVLLFAALFLHQRKLHGQQGPSLCISPIGIMIREVAEKPIPWSAIERATPLKLRIFITLRDGELEKLGLSSIALRLRKFGPLQDRTISIRSLLFDKPESEILEEIKKHARANGGDDIELNY